MAGNKVTRTDYNNQPIVQSGPKAGEITSAIMLDALSGVTSYLGNIGVIFPSKTCLFPNDTSSCQICGVGINLNKFMTDFNFAPLAFKFNKVTITAGKCLIGIE